MKFEFIPIKTRVVRPPKDEVWDILDGLELKDGDVVFITSKILAIHQGRCVKSDTISKDELIRREATSYLPHVLDNGFKINLTITENVLIPAAGIDESNADGHFILWPTGIDGLCSEIRTRMLRRGGLKRLGIIATDSHTTPLRYGVTGIVIGMAGVLPLRDIRGEKDIFGRTLHVTQVDLVDPLASMAVLLMGESAEQTPIVILRGYDGLVFDERGGMNGFKIPPECDLYRPLLDVMRKTK